MPELDDETLAAWRAFLSAHARVTRAIGRDLAEEGLPDLGWYDLLWTLFRQPERRLRVNELAHEVALTPTAMSIAERGTRTPSRSTNQRYEQIVRLLTKAGATQ